MTKTKVWRLPYRARPQPSRSLIPPSPARLQTLPPMHDVIVVSKVLAGASVPDPLMLTAPEDPRRNRSQRLRQVLRRQPLPARCNPPSINTTSRILTSSRLAISVPLVIPFLWKAPPHRSLSHRRHYRTAPPAFTTLHGIPSPRRRAWRTMLTGCRSTFPAAWRRLPRVECSVLVYHRGAGRR